MVLPLSGTVSVTNGLDTFEWTGTPLTPLNCVVGASIVIDGRGYFVKERTDTTHGLLTRVYAETTNASHPAEIEQLSPEQVQTATLNSRAAELYAQLSALDANRQGMYYNLIGVTGDNDPGPGRVAFNQVTPSDVTEIYLDVLDANEGGRDVTGLMDLWTPGTVLIIRSLATTAYSSYQIVSVDDETTYRRVTVDFIGSDGSLSTEPVEIAWHIIGTGIQIDYSGTYTDRATYDAAPAGKIFASIDGANGSGPPTVLYQKESATSGDWGPAIPFQGPESSPRVAVVMYDPGRPAASEVVVSLYFDVEVSFPADMYSVLTDSIAHTDVASTADAEFSIRKNGVEFGTLTFPSGVAEGIFDTTATVFDPGDRLTILAPNPRDDTLAQISITLAGTR